MPNTLKAKILDEIASEIDQCRPCRIGAIGKAVPGEGDPDARIVFVGEAPGKTEASTGRPFVGRSGQLLRQLIRSAGLRDKNVYITSVVKYFPKSGTPLNTAIVHGETHLDKQLSTIDPDIVVLLGRVACVGVLGEERKVLKEHGEIAVKNGRYHLITLHPAAVLRYRDNLPIIKSDFEKLKKISAY